jgi:hypothetical protein
VVTLRSQLEARTGKIILYKLHPPPPPPERATISSISVDNFASQKLNLKLFPLIWGEIKICEIREENLLHDKDIATVYNIILKEQNITYYIM